MESVSDLPRRWWLFSPTLDLLAFLAPALLAGLALLAGFRFGFLQSDSPEWTWICSVLLVDVAHVWSTGFRTYFDPKEFRERAVLYVATPLLSWLVGVGLYSFGPLVFWRCMAYLAVWHFVRQQYGWVVLYRRRLGEFDRAGHLLDSATIYLATIYPLIYWHCHLPRKFWWFVNQDFQVLPIANVSWLASLFGIASLACQILYWGRSFQRRWSGFTNPGKDLVVLTTTLCWYVGIVALNSDYAFTVTNVLIHGIPYMVLVYCWQSHRQMEEPQSAWQRVGRNWLGFLLTLWALAYFEEMFWDRAIWHDRPWLFGESWELASLQVILVPLLAVPQITHYVLDGFIWKRRHDSELAMTNTAA